MIKRTAFKITRAGQLVGNEASKRLGVPFGILDLSLAPTPEIGDSVALILEEMGLEKCGAHGTTAALALLTDAVKKGGIMASSYVGGLSGAFIPVSEDAEMIACVNCGALSFDKLEAMTSVCSAVSYTHLDVYKRQIFIRVFQSDPEAYYSIIAISIAPFFVALTSAYRGFFQGMQAMSYSAVSQIVDQMVRVGSGIALAYILTVNFGVSAGAAGATFGASAGAAAAFIFLMFSFIFFKRKQRPLIKQSQNMPNTSTKSILKSLVLIAIPVAFAGLVSTIMELINTATCLLYTSREGARCSGGAARRRRPAGTEGSWR